MGNKHEKLQTSQFVCTWFGGGVSYHKEKIATVAWGGCCCLPNLTPYLCSGPPLWHLHSVKLPQLSVHDSLSPADSDNNAPCVWLQVLHPLLQPNRPLVIHFFSFVCRIPFPLCVDEWRFLPAENATLETLQIIHHHHHPTPHRKKNVHNLHCSPSRLTWETSLNPKMNFDSSRDLS